MKNWLITLLILAASTGARAYTHSDSLVWKVQQILNTVNNELLEEISEVVLHPESGSISWVKTSEGRRYDFVINSSQGTAPTETTNGDITYFVTRKSYSGKISFKKDGDTLEVRFEFIRNGSDTMPYIFKVSKIESR